MLCADVGTPRELQRFMAWRPVTSLDTTLTLGDRKYRIDIEGEERSDGTWGGRVAFVDGKSTKRTGQETSQSNREALEYWATGLEAVYLEGALQRAK